MIDKIPKLLAPAGGKKQFFAALNSGADEVYLGLKSFSARASAENFSCEDLETLVPLARKYGMKVLVALNTVFEQKDLQSLPEIVSHLIAMEIGGIIVQDLGVARLIRKCFPQIALHASTQMAIHNVDGLNVLAEVGFSRVVLARELTLTELKTIVSVARLLGIETEVFCHGSLCYSYSGLCLFGGIMDARSGNRGTCPYPCRRIYQQDSTGAKASHLLSMRDLNTLNILEEICRTGVDVLKIEGRKKDELYVVSTLQSYRSRLNKISGSNTLRPNAPLCNIPSEDELSADLAHSFQRQSTTLFLTAGLNSTSGDNASTIDPDATTHAGQHIGYVKEIVAGYIRTVLNSDVELHDGLAIETESGELRPFGVDRLTVQGRATPKAKSNITVDILLPAEVFANEKDFPATGTKIFKIRSASLRARAGALSHPPPGERLRPLIPMQCSVSVTGISNEGTTKVSIIFKKLGDQILEHQIVLQAQPAILDANNANIKLENEFKSQFSVWGEANIQAEVEVTIPKDPIAIAPSQVKNIKRSIARELALEASLWREKKYRIASEFITVSETRAADDPKKQTHHITVRTDNLNLWTALNGSSEEGISYSSTFSITSSQLLKLRDRSGFAEFSSHFSKEHRMALPLILKHDEPETAAAVVDHLMQHGILNYEVGNLGSLNIVKQMAKKNGVVANITADHSLYTRNSESAKFLTDCGIHSFCISPEDSYENLNSKFFNEQCTPVALIFGDIALMHSESCVLADSGTPCQNERCELSGRKFYDERGRNFIISPDACRMVISSEKTWNQVAAINSLWTLGIRSFRIDFVLKDYTHQQAIEVIKNVTSAVRLLTET